MLTLVKLIAITFSGLLLTCGQANNKIQEGLIQVNYLQDLGFPSR
jgi:hypothetical protein